MVAPCTSIQHPPYPTQHARAPCRGGRMSAERRAQLLERLELLVELLLGGDLAELVGVQLLALLLPPLELLDLPQLLAQLLDLLCELVGVGERLPPRDLALDLV